MKALSEPHAAYLAALIDGEGCISIGRKISSNRGEASYSPHVGVSNTAVQLLRWALTVTGSGNLYPHKRSDSKAHLHKMGWVWSLRIDEIEPFLLAVFPHLQLKSPQATLMLEFLALESKFTRWSGVPLEVSIQRKLIWEELAELNKKGR